MLQQVSNTSKPAVAAAGSGMVMVCTCEPLARPPHICLDAELFASAVLCAQVGVCDQMPDRVTAIGPHA